eukprot:5771774-Karenia_brevis.AAC.1
MHTLFLHGATQFLYPCGFAANGGQQRPLANASRKFLDSRSDFANASMTAEPLAMRPTSPLRIMH